MRFLGCLTALLLILSLAGCESATDRALRNSPNFKAGYSDGCASAGSRGANPRESGRIRDDEAYRADKAYRTGWGMGFNACQNSQIPAAPNLGRF